MLKNVIIIKYILLFILFSSCFVKEDDNRITFWELESHEMQKFLDKQISKFENENPQVKVSRAHYSPEELRNQFQSAGIADAGPDIALAPNDFAGVWSISGLLMPAKEVADNEIFVDGTLDFVKVNGTIWGIPFTLGNHIMMFYNNSLLNEPPKTTDELISLGKSLKRKNPEIVPLVYNMTDTFTFIPWYSGFGGWPINNKQINLNNQSMVDALKFVKSLKYSHNIIPKSCDAKAAKKMFKDERAAMLLSGDWAIRSLHQELDDKLSISIIPEINATGKYPAPFVSGKYLFFNVNLLKNQEKFKLVKKFVMFLLQDEIQKKIAKQFKILPAKKRIFESKVVKNDRLLNSSYEQYKKGKGAPAEIEMRVCWDAIGYQLAKVMEGKVKPEIAAKKMQETADLKLMELRQ